MRLLRQLAFNLLALLVLAFGVLFATPSLTNTVSAAPQYAFSTSVAACNLGDNRPDIAIIETDPEVGGGLVGENWCLEQGSTDTFASGLRRITVNTTSPGTATLTIGSQSSNITIANPSYFSASVPQATQNQTAATAEEDQSCESIGNWAWAACPLINMAAGAINWLDTRIQAILEVDRERYTNPQLHEVWVNFRNLAYIILIPIMLIMVIGTALGMEIFSAYTVKRAMPRMGIAVIFIALSWHICVFLVGLSNVVGTGILGLMTAPFGMSGNMSLDTLFGASSSNAGDVASTVGSASLQWVAVLGSLAALAAIATAPGGLAILLLYLLPVAMFLLAAFFTLAVRDIFILASMVFGPVAILSWIFPGNDKLWKMWWNTFSKLLIMFPLIMMIIGAGRIGAYMVNVSGGGGVESVITPLLKLLAYTMPYVAIPFAFKWAGGLFAQISGIANDRSRGLLDGARKKRQEGMAGLRNRAGKNELYNKERAKNTRGFRGAWMRGMNTAGGWVADPVSNTKIKLGTQGGRKILSQVGMGHLAANQKLAEQFGQIGANDKLLRALFDENNSYEYKVRDANGQFVRNADGSIRKATGTITRWNGTMPDMKRVAQELSLAGQRTEDSTFLLAARTAGEGGLDWIADKNMNEETIGANVHAAASLALAQQGFIRKEDISSVAKGLTLGSEASGYVTTAQLLGARGAGMKPGYSVRAEIDANGNINYTHGDLNAMMVQATRMSTQDIGGMKGGELSTNFGDAFTAILSGSRDGDGHFVYKDAGGNDVVMSGADKLADGSERSARELLTQVYSSYTTPDTRNRIRKIIVDADVIKAGLGDTPEIRRQIEERVERELNRYGGSAIDDLRNQRPEPEEK